jgi:hypothetical protein
MKHQIFRLTKCNYDEQLSGPLYVIEDFPYPQFIVDELGEIKVFDTYAEAFAEAQACQDGYVIQF